MKQGTSRQKLIISRFDARLESIIGVDLPVLKKIRRYVIKSGGKRIRPLTHYHFCMLFGYQGSEWLDVGAIGELIHAASLLHDDVIDEATSRRSLPTVNALDGNKTAILGGDFLLACGMEHLRQLNHALDLIGIFTRVLRMLAVGELMQMRWEYHFALKQEQYQSVINHKTGVLFGAMCESAWVLSHGPENRAERNICLAFGEQMGRLFQWRDDYLDYFAESAASGKEQYQDFKRGLITAPVILMRDALKGAERKRLAQLWSDAELRHSDRGKQHLEELLHITGVQSRLALQIEMELTQLMQFLNQYSGHPSCELMQNQLQKLSVQT